MKIQRVDAPPDREPTVHRTPYTQPPQNTPKHQNGKNILVIYMKITKSRNERREICLWSLVFKLRSRFFTGKKRFNKQSGFHEAESIYRYASACGYCLPTNGVYLVWLSIISSTRWRHLVKQSFPHFYFRYDILSRCAGSGSGWSWLFAFALRLCIADGMKTEIF